MKAISQAAVQQAMTWCLTKRKTRWLDLGIVQKSHATRVQVNSHASGGGEHSAYFQRSSNPMHYLFRKHGISCMMCLYS